MSTDYYRPAGPVTQVVSVNTPWTQETHVYIQIQTVWAGTLRMSRGATVELAQLLIQGQPIAAHRFAGGPGLGCVLRIEDGSLRSDDTLISESGDITTLGRLMRDVDVVLSYDS